MLCLPAGNLEWKAGRFDAESTQFSDIFRHTMRDAGFESGSDSLFDESGDSSGEFAVGARVKNIEARLCFWQGQYTPVMEKGSANLVIEWQVFSRLQRKIVSTITTNGSAEIRESGPENVAPIILGAFKQNVIQLSMNDEFRKIFVTDANQSPPVGGISTSSNPIALIGSSPGSRSLADASGSVVAIIAGGGLGTGFLVSSDGYIVTNEHVVGAETQVRIRWSDGFESDGEVVRSHKARDVALIKTNPHGRQPLAVRRGNLPLGSTVFAVGTPLDLKFQGTVTKGAISANRVFGGFSFIQSDVGVSHGNSGGPLLDEKGFVVGITDWGHREEGEPANLNFFIPIGDALDFLNLVPAA